MKKIVLLLSMSFATLLSLFPFPSSAQDNFTLYLVRHAEKASTKQDPALTACGQSRANQLSTILRNIEIEAVYSTAYKRTMSTAQPTAKSKSIPIKQYAPNGLEQLARELIAQQKSGLIVGHSNTTPQLASILTGQTINEMTEKEYQHLFQVTFINGEALLTKLSQPLTCPQ